MNNSQLTANSDNDDTQYTLKDHLGNVRVTFTSKDETEANTATLEPANATTEQGKFLRYTTAKMVNSSMFDRTNGSAPSQTLGYAQRLNGSTNERYGLARSISVMPGDVINAEVYAKYVDPVTSNWNAALTTLVNQVAAGTAGVVVDGANYTTSTSSFPTTYPGLQSKTDNGAPKAYLNWLVFDRNFVFLNGGFKQITTAGKEAGTDVAHERVFNTNPIVIAEPGYVYIYVSNENTTPVDVYFDDFRVTHTKSPVIQQDDYYPFGLQFNSYSRENSIDQKYLYNGKEKQDALGLDWLDYGKRMYDPACGCWHQIDPSVEKYESISPYAYAFNNPIRFIDIKGSDPGDVVVIFAGADLFSDRGLGSTGNIVSSLRDQYFNERGGAVQNFSSTYWSPKVYNSLYGPGVSYSNTLTEGELDKATQEAYDYILKNYAEGGRVVVYGYSYGGVLASHLEKRLKENKIKVNLLVTVDAAAGRQSDQLDREVSDNTDENLNIYQRTPSILGSRGDKNKRSDGSDRKITNRVKVTYTDSKGKKQNISHDVIDEESAQDVIQSILNKLNNK